VSGGKDRTQRGIENGSKKVASRRCNCHTNMKRNDIPEVDLLPV
ncbi:hypothetical protein GBAR_LOCUS23038, partial [Geodia barretti]